MRHSRLIKAGIAKTSQIITLFRRMNVREYIRLPDDLSVRIIENDMKRVFKVAQNVVVPGIGAILTGLSFSLRHSERLTARLTNDLSGRENPKAKHLQEKETT